MTTDAEQRLIEDLRDFKDNEPDSYHDKLIEQAIAEIERLRGVEARYRWIREHATIPYSDEYINDALLFASRSTGAADVCGLDWHTNGQRWRCKVCGWSGEADARPACRRAADVGEER